MSMTLPELKELARKACGPECDKPERYKFRDVCRPELVLALIEAHEKRWKTIETAEANLARELEKL